VEITVDKTVKSRLIKYGLTSLCCLAVGALRLINLDFTYATTVDILNRIGDVFSVPGIVAILIGLLVMVSNEGAFAGFGYAFSMLSKLMTPGKGHQPESYSEYIQRKAEEKTTGYGFLFITGAAFVAIGAVFFIIAACIS
jgi:hypothetical protein